MKAGASWLVLDRRISIFETVVGHAEHGQALAAGLQVDLDELGAPEGQRIECGKHCSITPIEVSVAQAGKDIPQDRRAQRRCLALLADSLPASTGEGALEFRVRAIEALACGLVAGLDALATMLS